MILGKVVGQVVASHKDAGLEGFKMLLVQHVDLEQKLKPAFVVAVDAVGAGDDELVIVVQGSSARIAELTKNRPVDAAVIAIVDHVELEGQRVWSKFEAAGTGA